MKLYPATAVGMFCAPPGGASWILRQAISTKGVCDDRVHSAAESLLRYFISIHYKQE